MFPSTFASTGRRRLKATSTEADEALRCPLLSSRSPLSSPLAAGKRGTKEKLHFTENVLLGFLGETERSGFKKSTLSVGKFLKRACVVQRKGILIISNSKTPPRRETLYFVCDIYFSFFFFSCRPSVCVCVCVCVCVWVVVWFLFVYEHLSVCASELWDTRYWQNVFLPLDCTRSLSTVCAN